MGHKANICSLDFHPYGEFVASGSQDTNIKVSFDSWDSKGVHPHAALGRHFCSEGSASEIEPGLQCCGVFVLPRYP